MSEAPSNGAQHVADLAALEEKFELALSSMTMAFQPIVRAHDSSVYGYEALMRPKHPDIPHPGAMLDAAERLHRLEQLGRTLRTIAAREYAAETKDRGVLFVNMHALDLLDKTLTSRFTPLAKISKNVVLEITERQSLAQISDIKYRVAELRERGYRIAIDDLGAGHERMTQFDPADTDVVKLDISLVRDIDQHPIKQQLAQSIIALCKDNGILIVGEGIESAAEAETLRGLECDLFQGFFFCRPAPGFPEPQAV
jgi:EAL domain-containing protein (putative c-di-GMP-specific phosphodiesterase class I)